MKDANFNDVWIFVEVVQANGFRAAAANLNLGVGSVSETIRRLEGRLGVRLIERTTRKMSLTAAGEKLFQRSLPALKDLAHAMDEVGEEEQVISGTLRLSAPRSSSPFFLDDAISQYSAAYPAVNVEVMYDDNKVDLVTSGIDAAIRSKTLLQSGTYSMEVGPKLEMALVASPAYLQANGKPKKPSDLTNFDGIRFSFGRADRLAPWSFIEGKRSYLVTPKPRMIVNDLVSMISFAKSGLGFAYVYRKPVEPFIDSGELVALFDKSVPLLPRYTINYLTKRHMPGRLKAFVDLIKKI